MLSLWRSKLIQIMALAIDCTSRISRCQKALKDHLSMAGCAILRKKLDRAITNDLEMFKFSSWGLVRESDILNYGITHHNQSWANHSTVTWHLQVSCPKKSAYSTNTLVEQQHLKFGAPGQTKTPGFSKPNTILLKGTFFCPVYAGHCQSNQILLTFQR